MAPENSNPEVTNSWCVLYQSLKVLGFKGLFAGTDRLCPSLETGYGKPQVVFVT